MFSVAAAVLFGALAAQAQEYTATWDPANLPPTSENDQLGTNQCGTGNNQTSLCQNAFVNSVEDFCVWGPPEPDSEIGVIEQYAVSYCTHPGRGGRLIPLGVLRAAHFVETPDYIQITGNGDFTKINIRQGDAGGEMDPHGPDGLGNPHGGLVFSNIWVNGTGGLGQQIHEWTNFMSFDQFCIKACKPGANAPQNCEHIYDVMGCMWNIPGNYAPGFTSCQGDSITPMGLYPQPDGSTSTFHQGEPATPPPHAPAATSQCVTYTSSLIYSTASPTPTPSAPNGSGPTSSAPAPTESNGAAATVSPAFTCFVASALLGLSVGASFIL